MSKFFSCKNVYGFLIVFFKKKRKWKRENENGKQVQDSLKGATVDLISPAYGTVDWPKGVLIYDQHLFNYCQIGSKTFNERKQYVDCCCFISQILQFVFSRL